MDLAGKAKKTIATIFSNELYYVLAVVTLELMACVMTELQSTKWFDMFSFQVAIRHMANEVPIISIIFLATASAVIIPRWIYGEALIEMLSSIRSDSRVTTKKTEVNTTPIMMLLVMGPIIGTILAYIFYMPLEDNWRTAIVRDWCFAVGGTSGLCATVYSHFLKKRYAEITTENFL